MIVTSLNTSINNTVTIYFISLIQISNVIAELRRIILNGYNFIQFIIFTFYGEDFLV